jgi:hypothetical protein
VLALPALPKAPKPPLQDPAPLAVALMLTAVVPHAVYGPPAFAVAAGFTVMVVWQLLLQPGATKRHASFDALQLEEFRPGTTTATVPVAFSMPMVPGAMLLMDVVWISMLFEVSYSTICVVTIGVPDVQQ